MFDDELPPVVDVEQDGLWEARVRGSLEAFAELWERTEMIDTSRSTWHQLVGRDRAWALAHPMWVADWGKVVAPRLPTPWREWNFWQKTSTGQFRAYRQCGPGPVQRDGGRAAGAVLEGLGTGGAAYEPGQKAGAHGGQVAEFLGEELAQELAQSAVGQPVAGHEGLVVVAGLGVLFKDVGDVLCRVTGTPRSPALPEGQPGKCPPGNRLHRERLGR